MENLLKQLEILRERILKTKDLLDIKDMRARAHNLRIEMNKPDFWSDREKAVGISREAEDLEAEVDVWDDLSKETNDLEQLVAVGQDENDYSIAEEAHLKYAELLKKFEKLDFLVLFSGKYDQSSAILSIHAGTGGVDAQDWAEMLERMYLRFAEKMKWRVEILDRNIGNEAGLKSATLEINGRWAFGYLKSENGVHRLVRISPFDAEQMRHTSFALVEILPVLPETLELDIKDEDLKIDTYRSSGPGGQNVNKTDSAIRITHLPSKIVVACQSERSQHQNRERAMIILKSKLFKLQEEDRLREQSNMKGDIQKAEWGKQIRSYVLQPYQMVKDHRTNQETSDIGGVLDGNLNEFMEAYLRREKH
jgi:peptide chain release factor 2